MFESLKFNCICKTKPIVGGPRSRPHHECVILQITFICVYSISNNWRLCKYSFKININLGIEKATELEFYYRILREKKWNKLLSCPDGNADFQTDRQTDNTLFMNNNSGHTQVAYEKICNIHTLNRWRTMASLRISRTKTDNRLGWCQLRTCILYTYMKHNGVYIRVYSFLSE